MELAKVGISIIKGYEQKEVLVTVNSPGLKGS